jgi:hypothetical protein
MKNPTTLLALAAGAAALTLAACATPDAGASAGVACQGLATADGLRVVSLGQETAADGSTRIPVQVEDRVGRRVNAVCVVAGQSARWATPLPAGLATR